MRIFAERLIDTRNERGYTQTQLAEILDIPQSTYMHYELLGRTKAGAEPPLEMLVKIADALDVSIDYLLGREDYLGNEIKPKDRIGL
ncbi:MAG: helix-turn-helix domain-containing protein [Clostridiales bacterium]|jgi:transcriptional regulator with XRE-family HTH domain|nr:helix-turn-helix domain-containing protein [Clostridiales bacterium]